MWVKGFERIIRKSNSSVSGLAVSEDGDLIMTKSWRPEGWEMPLEIKPVGESGKKAFHMIDRFSYEAGADAMLEALTPHLSSFFTIGEQIGSAMERKNRKVKKE